MEVENIHLLLILMLILMMVTYNFVTNMKLSTTFIKNGNTRSLRTTTE